MSSTAITDVRVFDGADVLPARTVVITDATISQVGGSPPRDAEIVDGRGTTLVPGLIDAHVHTDDAGLRQALRFGVTTELEMQGPHTGAEQARVSADDDLADVRSAGFGITPPGGHPYELIDPSHAAPASADPSTPTPWIPFCTAPVEAIDAVAELVARGSDYIKFMIDDGRMEGHPGLPVLDRVTLRAGIAEAHRHNKLTVAHALTIDAARTAVDAGIDGLVHVFMDGPHTPEIVDLVARAGVFVVPCVVVNASIMGITGTDLLADPRVADRLDPPTRAHLAGSMNCYPAGRLSDVLGSVTALHDAGVDILCGTDAAFLRPTLAGLAHGASVHRELEHLVAAGLAPNQALAGATSGPARRFGLSDRGRIAPGLRADLLLVDGDPTRDITDTLDIRTVWRRGNPTHHTGPWSS